MPEAAGELHGAEIRRALARAAQDDQRQDQEDGALVSRGDLDVKLAYQSGRATFMGLSLQVAPGALVPRQETELLGETAVELLGARQPSGAGLRAVDMCCGSGNL